MINPPVKIETYDELSCSIESRLADINAIWNDLCDLVVKRFELHDILLLQGNTGVTGPPGDSAANGTMGSIGNKVHVWCQL